MYRDLNDYEMLYLICDGDDINFEIMLKKYAPLINKICIKYQNIVKKMGYEYDDLHQVCSLTLFQCLRGYNGYNSDNLFYTYFQQALENAVLSIIKTNSTYRKRMLNESISYDNYIPNTSITYAENFYDSNVQFYLSNIINYTTFYINYRNSLDFDNACILDLKVEGYSNTEISCLLCISYNQVAKCLHNVRHEQF